MNYAIVLIFALAANSLYAKCQQLDSKTLNVSWKAYKMPAKVGVGGKFTQMSLINEVKGEDAIGALQDLKFNINTKSVETGDKARDAKIFQFFFKKLKDGRKISGTISKVTNSDMIVNFKINGQSTLVPLAYTIEGNKIKAEGFIDILDFAGLEALKSITRACKAKHENKTWSDVNLYFEGQLKSCKK